MKRSSILLLVILIIATFFRLYHFSSTPPGLYPDEAIDGNNAIQATQTRDYKVFYTEDNGREGLYVNIAAFFIKEFGNKPWALRLPAALFGILTVLGLYFLGKELYSKNIGLLAAFLLSVNFWHVNFSRIAFRAIMAPFFAVWAFYFLMLAFRDPNTSKKKSFIFAAIGGLLFGLGVYTYIAFRILPVLALVLLFLYWLRSKKISKTEWLGFLIFVGASVLIALPILIYFLHNPGDFTGRTSEISIFGSASPVKTLALNTLKTLNMFFFAGDGNWRHNFSGAPELFWPVALFFLIGIILAIKKFREEKLQSGFLFGWFILALAPVVFSSEGIPHALRSILLVPPVFLLSAVGAMETHNFFRYKFSKRTLNIASAAVLLLIAFYGYKEYFWDWAHNPNVAGAFNADYVKIGQELNSVPKETPKYVIVEAGGVLVNGIPMPAQTVMFITDTFTPEKQKDKNMHYVLPGTKIPPGAYTAVLN
jgi:4-amino-4-deoxy-L-arabinose transferase-like glycosyltransferase